MEKIILNGMIGLSLVAITSCGKKVDADPALSNTIWVSEDGTKTLEFGKKEILMNDVAIYSGDGEVFVQDGQIWADENGELTYFFDYKISGENLFVASEITSAWNDPSSPAVVSEKYKQQ